MTNREFFQYGPFINPISDSKMSNHLGFNGFIITSDGKVPFLKRNKYVSIGKAHLWVECNGFIKNQVCFK